MKSRKMDKKLVASKQSHEVKYVIKKFSDVLGKEQVLMLIRNAGRSRVTLYKVIAEYLLKRLRGPGK